MLAIPTEQISIPLRLVQSSSRVLAIYLESSLDFDVIADILTPSTDIWLMADWRASINSLKSCSERSFISILSVPLGANSVKNLMGSVIFME